MPRSRETRIDQETFVRAKWHRLVYELIRKKKDALFEKFVCALKVVFEWQRLEYEPIRKKKEALCLEVYGPELKPELTKGEYIVFSKRNLVIRTLTFPGFEIQARRVIFEVYYNGCVTIPPAMVRLCKSAQCDPVCFSRRIRAPVEIDTFVPYLGDIKVEWGVRSTTRGPKQILEEARGVIEALMAYDRELEKDPVWQMMTAVGEWLRDKHWVSSSHIGRFLKKRFLGNFKKGVTARRVVDRLVKLRDVVVSSPPGRVRLRNRKDEPPPGLLAMMTDTVFGGLNGQFCPKKEYYIYCVKDVGNMLKEVYPSYYRPEYATRVVSTLHHKGDCDEGGWGWDEGDCHYSSRRYCSPDCSHCNRSCRCDFQ